jgi:hypothetical protein
MQLIKIQPVIVDDSIRIVSGRKCGHPWCVQMSLDGKSAVVCEHHVDGIRSMGEWMLCTLPEQETK